ncbi:hypothetical protein B0H17DRAFT_1179776 [Mycena rosella]|uniref:Uncharacterized protein n=1 Tax=Mycena rosella TaxID=1033263 RepID=A0AAD7DGA4_MYCRO|nr:hypothetical protein B0H17DRAFT_1179776 [Mycena rosella]
MKLLDSPPSSESTERLIGALQGCFSDLLRTQKAQTDKLHKAVEALQQKPPVADKKNIFWKQYQSLADEHDKELLQKFGTDLDTSLIFYTCPLGRRSSAGTSLDGDSDEAAKNNRILQGVSELLVQLADTILTGSHHERVDFDWGSPDKIDGLESSFVADWQPGYVLEAP